MYKLIIKTHKGLFKFNRLPFGIKVMPEIFQQIMDVWVGNLDLAVAYLDGILIKSRNHKKHMKHVKLAF